MRDHHALIATMAAFADDIQSTDDNGIKAVCNPPVNNRYCPDSTVTRGQMAAFLHRASP